MKPTSVDFKDMQQIPAASIPECPPSGSEAKAFHCAGRIVAFNSGRGPGVFPRLASFSTRGQLVELQSARNSTLFRKGVAGHVFGM